MPEQPAGSRSSASRPEAGSAPPTPHTYDDAPPEPGAPKVGEIWRRKGMKLRVRIGRVWTICGCDSVVMHAFREDHGAHLVGAVRCHPCHGGKAWWALVPDFLERFDREEPDG